MLSEKKVCFLGAGAMAEAVLAGMLNKRIIKPGAVSITNRSDRFRLDELVYNFGVVADANQKDSSIQDADILILAMKPKDVASALEEIKHLTNPNQLVISVVAGITTTFITSLLGHQAPVIRTMPNTSATIGLSATGVCQGETATEEHLELAKHIFESIGMVAVVEEHQLDAVTGLSGSGPAYIYYLVESLQSGAVQAGLDEQVARELILQTLIGAAHMLKETGEDPAVLREKVTSPNGTTQAGLDKLRSFQFEEALVSCVLRATERSKELGAILSETKS
ncbi:pyrroline-5-carboxylate reductase [Ammoniphilus sp. CFH 90114]|uniref:pyrroline-5-carboxylate reductase n=1 Tax=Ammoniphilus sp. CFH 90114 TaxID=2493665 RepID=UPI00100FA124|nr:pyrroline-5-carboxylate reductase [Ammoniphilus sp. CFH 90114]RXT05705.1 pyrroline-5-carboxylate reductase [Ammoniphilus sp. CFH 90114]